MKYITIIFPFLFSLLMVTSLSAEETWPIYVPKKEGNFSIFCTNKDPDSNYKTIEIDLRYYEPEVMSLKKYYSLVRIYGYQNNNDFLLDLSIASYNSASKTVNYSLSNGETSIYINIINSYIAEAYLRTARGGPWTDQFYCY